jgi:hypothetical protein
VHGGPVFGVLLDQPLHNLVPANTWLAAVYVNLHKFFILLLDEVERFFGVEI